jgi:SAM-dependent methyltransferase
VSRRSVAQSALASALLRDLPSTRTAASTVASSFPELERSLAIAYDHWQASWPEFDRTIHEIARLSGVTRVCDVGGGANPRFDLETIERLGLDLTLQDVSASELRKAADGYRKVCGDILAPSTLKGAEFDLVFSREVAEHIRDPRAFHKRLFELLVPGGYAIHMFPTMYALPFVANRFLPDELSRRLLSRVQGWRDDEGSEGKFPAYYRWCRGPSKRQVKRFEAIGYQVKSYSGYFGHSYYRKLGPLGNLEEAKSRFLVGRPVAALTSFAVVKLRRPDLPPSARSRRGDA